MIDFLNASFEASFGEFHQLPASLLPEICFSGRSNVGKSSLINKLLNRKSIARVSSKPGKTRTINFFLLKDLRLVDLPGYGYAKISAAETERFSLLMENYFKSGRDIRLVVQLVDMRIGPTTNDEMMIDFLQYNKIPFCIALTKCDKLNKTEYTNMLKKINDNEKLSGISIIPFSSVSGIGVEELKKEIEKSIKKDEV